MKNNIDFYQHYADADQHPKFKMLRVEYGWAGEGKFWALNNRIAQSEDCRLDINKKYIAASISSDLDFKLNEFKEFIKYLLTECELIEEIEPGILTTDIIQENFDRVSVNREKARDRKQRSLKKVLKSSIEKQKSSGERNNKVKVKESKVKETLYSELKKFLLKNLPEELKQSEKSILSFYEHRMKNKIKNKNQPYETTKGIDGLFRDLKNCLGLGYNINDCCDVAIENSWLTPRVSYFENIKMEPVNNVRKVKTIEDREREEKELFANRVMP